MQPMRRLVKCGAMGRKIAKFPKAQGGRVGSLFDLLATDSYS
jgi:hypothetical protein